MSIAELAHGLPDEVVELALMIYGAHGDVEEAVQCYFDSAAGLGDGFGNYMGALMGCVLSPDKAKIFLNSIACAIVVHVRGVWMFGSDGERIDSDEVWRRIVQVLFADDWVGFFQSGQGVAAAWALWSLWTPIFGSKLGIKGKVKTVVSGVMYDASGAPKAMRDPGLVTADGRRVPFMSFREAYTYMGLPRRADCVDRVTWNYVVKQLMKGVHRLRRLQRVSRRVYMLVSDSLIVGVGGAYFQSFYVSWKQAQAFEARWRSGFNAKFQRPRDAPNVELYGEGKRTHLWTVAISTLYSSVVKSIGDVDDTPQRAACRSTLALAFERLGCREDPGRWDGSHLKHELEAWLAGSSCRYIGSAWILIDLLLRAELRGGRFGGG